MKTLIIFIAIKLMVVIPICQQPDSAEKSRSGKTSPVKAKVVAKPKDKGSATGGLLYRFPLSI
jgi:hypothetical protein